MRWHVIFVVNEHCHFTGKYRGATHNICNLRFNVPNKFPVAFDKVVKI